MVGIYTEKCLDRSLFESADAEWLSSEEPFALKQTDNYDQSIRLDDASIIDRSSQDQKNLREEILHCLNQLHPALKNIVDAELKRGNRVYSAGIGYPQEKSISVTMSKPFTRKYKGKEIKFSICNDPHYWSADYSTLDEPIHLLIS